MKDCHHNTNQIKSNQIKKTLLVVITVLHYDTDINLAFWRYNINEGEKKSNTQTGSNIIWGVSSLLRTLTPPPHPVHLKPPAFI